VSRLDYAPKLKEIQITDIKKGLGVFTPKPEARVSFAALKATLKSAGYTLDAADISVLGTLARGNEGWIIVADSSGQPFAIEGKTLDRVLAGAPAGAHVEINGNWKTVGDSGADREVIEPGTMKKASNANAPRAGMYPQSSSNVVLATFDSSETVPFSTSKENSVMTAPLEPLAPIRVTSPGLTVYKGGAVTPRLYFIKQHLGPLELTRQMLDLSVSYTPGPRLQLEAEIPFSHTSFDNGENSGSGTGLGNLTLWSKYRFFRTVKTYGDRQAAARFGLELPTGNKSGPSAPQLNAPAFVRQQLTPIGGGLSAHFDLALSQAGGRFIFGGNAEGIVRAERDGYRTGHELRANTDLEYVLLPRKYVAPGKELFVILETSFIYRGTGRLDSTTVSGSKSTEYYLAPGLQYAAAPRFVIEGSIQFPVVRNTGPLLLRTDRNVLLGIRYLF